MKPFGLAIAFDVSSDRYEIVSSMCKQLRDSLHLTQDHMTHQAFGERFALHCPVCAHFHYRFWAQVAFALSICECGKLNYKCGQTCEFWEDY